MNTLPHVFHRVALNGHTAMFLLQCYLFYSREELRNQTLAEVALNQCLLNMHYKGGSWYQLAVN